MSNALQEFLADDGEPTEAKKPPFKVDGPKTAEWALLKIRQLQAQNNENRLLAAHERERIDNWLDEVLKDNQGSIDYFTSELEGHHRGIIRSEEEAGVEDKYLTKSIKLPAGTLKSRMTPPTVSIEDEDEAIAWLEDNDQQELLIVQKAIDKTAIKKLPSTDNGHIVTTDGEPIPGVFIEPGERRFSIEVKP